MARILSRIIFVRHRSCGGEFGLGSGRIAKLLFQAPQANVGDKRGRFLGLGRARQIIFEHFGCQGRIAAWSR